MGGQVRAQQQSFRGRGVKVRCWVYNLGGEGATEAVTIFHGGVYWFDGEGRVCLYVYHFHQRSGNENGFAVELYLDDGQGGYAPVGCVVGGWTLKR